MAGKPRRWLATVAGLPLGEKLHAGDECAVDVVSPSDRGIVGFRDGEFFFLYPTLKSLFRYVSQTLTASACAASKCPA
jgi:hypothetical protein